MRVRFAAQAGRHLDAIFRFIAAENPRAASELVGTIMRVTERLASFPHLGRPARPPSRCVLKVPGVPYRVYYRIVGDEIRITAIRHTSRRPLRSLS